MAERVRQRRARLGLVLTATPTVAPGYVTVYPAGTSRPVVSTLNTRGTRAVADTAIILY